MIVVTGATGGNGSEIVRLLAERGAAVRGMVRDPDRARGRLPDSVELVRGDFDAPETLAPAMRGARTLMLISSADPALPTRELAAVEAAKAAGIKRIVKFSVIAADQEPTFGFGHWHRPVEDAIRASGLAWTFLRPNVFMQNLFWFTEPIKSDGVFGLPVGDANVSVIDTRDIAACAAAVLSEDGHDGQAYLLTGPEALSFQQQADVLSNVLGRSIHHEDITPEEHKRRLLSFGQSEAYADAELELDAELKAGELGTVSDSVKRLTGRPARSFRDFAGDFAQEFQTEVAS